MPKLALFLFPALFSGPVFAPADGAGGAAVVDAQPAAGDAAAANPPAGDASPAAPDAGTGDPAPKWYEAKDLLPEYRRALEAKGLTGIEDPAEAAVKLAKFYHEAEKMIGDKRAIKGPDKDQSFADWMKANAKTFGLPESEDGYKVEKPTDWPKDLPWNDDLDTKARQLALSHGVPPDIHKAYVGMVAEYQKDMAKQVDAQIEAARSDMMAELVKDWGQQTDARITVAKQAMQHFAAEAGLSQDAISVAMSSLKDKIGDAATMRLFHAIGASMGEDRAVQIGKSGAMGQTPAEARAEIAAMSQPGGEYFEATKANDRARMARAQERITQLAKLAAG